MPSKNNTSSDKQQKIVNAKATHSERTKGASKGTSAESIAGPSKSPPASRKPPTPSKRKSEPVFKAPTIRIVDFRTETSPTRVQTESASEMPARSSPLTKKQSQRRVKPPPSITAAESTNGETESISSGPPPRAKPISAVSRVSLSTNRSQTPASENNNDNASGTDSIVDTSSISANRIKRTEAERKQYFENQPECGSSEVHRAFCTRCKEWVKLSMRQTYYVKPWEVHRAKCDQKLPSGDTYKDLGLIATIPFVVPKTEKFRRVLLELDDIAEIIEPNQIKCKTCQEWVPLEKKYSIKCWARHEGGCHDDLKPGDVEKMLERKLFFMCDKQCKGTQNKHYVECAACNEEIGLNPDNDYDLDLWLTHKEICHFDSNEGVTQATAGQSPERVNTSTTAAATLSEPELSSTQPQTRPEPDTERLTSQPPPGPERTATLPSTDSERTLVPSSSSIPPLRMPPPPTPEPALASTSLPPAAVASASGSFKRKRESDTDGHDQSPDRESLDDVDMDEERPTRRARTTGYIPEDRDPPSGLGWFLLPFQAFVEGFKQSLTTLDS